MGGPMPRERRVRPGRLSVGGVCGGARQKRKARQVISFDRVLSELLDESRSYRENQYRGFMKDDLRRQALANWRKLFSMPESLISAEARYEKLLMAADHMERAELISSDEWRKLVQLAGASFASTAECMGGTGQ
jgi:hypothetical protein